MLSLIRANLKFARNGNKTRREPSRGAEYDLPVVLLTLRNLFGLSLVLNKSECTVGTSFEACSLRSFSVMEICRLAAQIFENLVGRNYLLRQNSEFNRARSVSQYSNESLIPAQNQRWRRA